MKFQKLISKLIAFSVFAGVAVAAPAAPQFFRLYEGITLYVNNPQGVEFTVNLEVRDLNLVANGPREVLYKVYDPDGQPVVREVIPDDGVTSPNFPDRIGGWDHELQYMANLYAKGTLPSVRWSAWSDPGRLNRILPTTRASVIKGGKKGVYRIVLAGTPDHYVTIHLSPDLKYGVCGHPNFLHAHGDQLKKSYIYVPKNTVGIFFAATEPDLPRARRFKLTAPDGKALFDAVATGGYASAVKESWQDASIKFDKPGEYDGKVLTVEVSDGPGDYLMMMTLQQAKAGPFADYVGMGSSAIFAPDPETALALQGGAVVVDDLVFWHPFQVKFYNWLKANKVDLEEKGVPAAPPTPRQTELQSLLAKLDAMAPADRAPALHQLADGFAELLPADKVTALQKFSARLDELSPDDRPKILHKLFRDLFNSFRLLETSDGRGSFSWHNWAYAMGYYGCRIFRASWVLMGRADVPQDLKNIIKEGLLVGGDRLSFATSGETVNGNSFSQINVALWYCHKASGDPFQKERFEVFFDRWQHQGWGAGAGLSRSGDSQEHFAHDMHYGSYLMDNWKAVGNTWVQVGGILGAAKDEPRFQQIMDRYRNLYSHLYCREKSGHGIAANPWSARTAASAHVGTLNWETQDHIWKGEPGPDFTVSVNDGDEWFAARRKNYYFLTFHGRLAPEWMSQCFPGQLGFGGGIICQLTVPGKGPVIASVLNGMYGEGMHPSQWRNFNIHSIVGEMWDGSPLIAGISEHDDAKLAGNTVTSSGEVRNTHVRSARSYTCNADSIDCEVALAESDYARALSIWSHGRLWSEVKSAYEMIPFVATGLGKAKATAVTLKDAAGADLGPATKDPREARAILIDRGGFGVEVQLEKPLKVKLGMNNTVLIQIIEEGPKPAPAANVKLKYRLTPFGGG